MSIRVAIENNNEGRSIAWALEHPGCFAYGADAGEALRNFPEAARTYAEWIARHAPAHFAFDPRDEIVNEESFDVYFVDKAFEPVDPGRGSMVESFFRHDWKPLTPGQIESALDILLWSRADLLATVEGLDATTMSRKLAGERWDISGILNHIGAAEWWYQERIGYPDPLVEEDLSPAPFERLRSTRDHFRQLLPRLEGLNHVVGLDGEFWSPRKVLRRLVWHERDHTEHIRKLL